MSPLRMRMIQDMQLMGLAVRTQSIYVDAVRRLAKYYRRSPDSLSEEEVRSYQLGLRERGIARGTFKHNQHGIQFLYRHTLDREWPLFAKKGFVGSPIASALATVKPHSSLGGLSAAAPSLSSFDNPTARLPACPGG